MEFNSMFKGLNTEDCHNFDVNLVYMWWLMSRRITWEITVLFTPVLCTSFWWESSIESSEILEDVVVNQCGHCYKLFTGSSITIITHIIRARIQLFLLEYFLLWQTYKSGQNH